MREASGFKMCDRKEVEARRWVSWLHRHMCGYLGVWMSEYVEIEIADWRSRWSSHQISVLKPIVLCSSLSKFHTSIILR